MNVAATPLGPTIVDDEHQPTMRFENAMAALVPRRPERHDHLPYGYMPDYGSEMAEGLFEMLAIDAEVEFKTCIDRIAVQMAHLSDELRLQAWAFAVKAPLPIGRHDDHTHVVLQLVQKFPGAVDDHVAAGLCALIDDPNHEDEIKRLLPLLPATVLDTPMAAAKALGALGCYRRHAAVGLSVLERLSTSTLDSLGDALHECVPFLAKNQRLLKRLERLIQRVEAPQGLAFERHRDAALNLN